MQFQIPFTSEHVAGLGSADKKDRSRRRLHRAAGVLYWVKMQWMENARSGKCPSADPAVRNCVILCCCIYAWAGWWLWQYGRPAVWEPQAYQFHGQFGKGQPEDNVLSHHRSRCPVLYTVLCHLVATDVLMSPGHHLYTVVMCLSICRCVQFALRHQCQCADDNGWCRVFTDRESPGNNLARESLGILLMVRGKWCVSSELCDCCLFFLEKNENAHSVHVITNWWLKGVDVRGRLKIT